ncbi:MAG: hypothetical protein QM686_19300, partial [Herbaspirillum sp.]
CRDVLTKIALRPNVTAYSAHYNEQITGEVKTLYCEYTAKGRVKEFKKEVDKLINTRLGEHGIIKSTTPRKTS